MKKLLFSITLIAFLFFPKLNFGQAPNINSQPTNTVVCSGVSVSFSVAATGAALTYQWRKGNMNLINGGNISGVNTPVLTINPVNVSDASSDFNVIVSGSASPSDTSNYAILDVNTAPIITTQPINQTICEGDSVKLSVVATGFNLTYQWRNGTTNLVSGGNILDATSSTLIIYPVTLADAGNNYNVVVTGGCPPPAVSQNATLLINAATNITTQPVNQTVCLGNSASFVVSATGTGLTYQWRKGNVNLSNTINVTGVNTPTLTINTVTALDTASNYNVVVSGSCGNDTSINVFLRFNTINILNQPSNQTICAGGSASFSVTTTGIILGYQWMNGSVILLNGGNISGANTASLTINPATFADTSSFYHVVILGSCALIDSSINVSLKLNMPPTITTQPVNQTLCAGSSATFFVTATGSNLTYQWRKGSVNLVNGGNISGANTATLTINPASLSDTSSFYNVVITGSCPPNDTSVYAFLKFNSPNIFPQPSSQTVCPGSAAVFPVAATGAGLVYQWRRGTVDLVNGGNISGANSATLIINPTTYADTASNYNVVITGTCPPNDTSVFIFLRFNNPVVITQPNNQTICSGSSASFSVGATGANLTYQWRKGSVNLVNGGNISGVNTSVLTINPATVADTSSFYNVVVSGSCAPNDTSINVYLKINTPPSITTQPVNQTVCSGNSISFSVSASGTGITYQWMKGNTALVNGGNISGVNTPTLTVNPTTISDTSSFYYVVITGACSPKDTSLKVSLKINPATNIIIQPTNQTVCLGNSASFSVGATGTGLTYQWRRGAVNLINGATISGVNTATLTINPVTALDTASNYNVVITGSCGNDTSINVFLHFNKTNIISQPPNQTVCAGSSASFSVAATGGTLTYQWMNGNVILLNGGHVSGSNTATLTINPATLADTSSFYHVIVTGTCALLDTSINVSLKINTAPSITTQPIDQTVCGGSMASFSVAATGTGLTYQWMNGNIALVNGGNISGANIATLTINPASVSDTSSFYHVVITGVCAPSFTSNNVYLKLNVATNITMQPINQTICPGGIATFSVAAAGTGLTYQWMKGNVILINSGNISGATTATLIINPATLADTSSYYHVVISGVCNPNDTSINASLMLNTIPSVITQPSDQTVCTGSAVSFSVIATGTGISYQWMNGNVILSNNGNISGTNTATLMINPTNISDTSSFYYVVINGTCAPKDTSVKVFLHENALPIVTANTSTTSVCYGSSVTLTGGGALTYTWTSGVTNGVAFIPAVTNTYTVTGTNGNNCANTATVSVTVNKTISAPTSNSPICMGSTINLNTLAQSGATYNWTGPNGFTSAIQNPSITSASFVNGGTYSLSVTNNWCSADSTVEVVITNCNGTDLSVTKTVDNAHPLIGNTVTFTIVAHNNGPNNAIGVIVGDTLQSGYAYVTSSATKGTYNPSIGIWAIDTLNTGMSAILTVTVKVNASGNYVNTATIHSNGVDSMMTNNLSSVETFPTDFFIPEGFSPNGDGINDFYVIRGLDNYPNNTFTVFNRWGDKVYGASPYTNTWDGKATSGLRVGGDDLPVGTYFYTLDLGDGSKVFKGSIYLNK